MPIRDGDKRDRPEHRCVDVVQGLPRCMDMITPEEVTRRIELYAAGRTFRYLRPAERRAAERGVAATANNPFDRQRLNLHSAGTACDAFAQSIPEYKLSHRGRGIVICGGGGRYFPGTWVCVHMLRRLKCSLPIQVWHLGKKEMDARMKSLLAPLGVECVDAFEIRRRHPVRCLGGWELKPYAMLHSPFREVLLLDADNVPVLDPEFLFETPEFKATGAIFWPDFHIVRRGRKARVIWRSCGLRAPDEPEFESGQIVLDKARCWKALSLAMWFNENSDFYYEHFHGDKETFHLAFRKVKQRYALVRHPIHALEGTMCQHDFAGRRVFQHRNMDKWDLFLHNARVKDFQFEDECRADVQRLRKLWDGGLGSISKGATAVVKSPGRRWRDLRITGVVVSAVDRRVPRQKTLEALGQTDWNGTPTRVELHDGQGEGWEAAEAQCAFRALRNSLEQETNYILLLDDDLRFNQFLRHNLERWRPLHSDRTWLATIFNPRVRETACDLTGNSRIVEVQEMFACQAFLMAREAVRYVVKHWDSVGGRYHYRILRLVGRRQREVFHHAPSLVQRVGGTPGEVIHRAMDFRPEWKA